MRKSSLLAAVSAGVLTLGMTSASLAQARAPGATHEARVVPVRTGLAAGNPFCKRLAAKRFFASAGAHTFCFGRPALTATNVLKHRVGKAAPTPANVNAATTSEDVNPAGVAAPGQSETSIAASGPYVVEAWNDATAFLTSCPAPMFKEEGTGVGFSNNGGKTFTDLGGLPNLACNKDLYQGDPSVAAYVAGGHTYFYISSLFNSPTGLGPSEIAMDACAVTGSGSTATLSCGQPVLLGSSTQCQIVKTGRHSTIEFCSFTDKDFIAINPAHGRLYATYTDFLLNGGTQVTMSVCDLGSPIGGPGPVGGTPTAPVCEHGTKLVPAPHNMLIGKPYFTVARPHPLGCENEGAYPAVDVATGAVYVAYEFNIFTDQFSPCNSASTPTADVMTGTVSRCLVLAPTSRCSGPTVRIAQPIKTLVATPVPGYNRAGVNDFPRLAVSDPAGTVSMVWNDVEHHPLGDILMESFSLGSLNPIQAQPVVLDAPGSGGMHIFPAVRTANASGALDVVWYSRATPNTVLTDVVGAIGVDPRTTVSPSSNVLITDTPSDWINTASLIIPNFGDYIDAAIDTTGSAPYVGKTLYVAWSDGRIGIPQPFEANLPG
jgi:hypothetical protein